MKTRSFGNPMPVAINTEREPKAQGPRDDRNHGNLRGALGVTTKRKEARKILHRNHEGREKLAQCGFSLTQGRIKEGEEILDLIDKNKGKTQILLGVENGWRRDFRDENQITGNSENSQGDSNQWIRELQGRQLKSFQANQKNEP